MITGSHEVHQYFSVFFIATFLSLIMNYLAWRGGFFSFNPKDFAPAVKGRHVLEAFIVFLFAQILLIPAAFIVALAFKYGVNIDPADLLTNQTLKGWLTLFSIIGGLIAVYLASLSIVPAQRQLIWGQSSPLPWYKNLGFGALSWFYIYPLVLALGAIIELMIYEFYHQLPVDQVAVKQMKSLQFNPVLFFLTSVVVVTCVPIVEELLFRGLLQSWLKNRFKSSKLAILLTSLTFALFHFSTTQGITNIELLSELFLLSCFLGFLYERQRSLWTSIGLHAFFNAVSLLLLIDFQ